MTTPVTIFVIDDDEPLRHALSYALEVSGYRVLGFASASDFLDRRADLAGDILISDIRLPGIEGITLTRRLREVDTALPVILITGHADQALRAEALAAGAVAVLEKPCELRSLIDEIERALAM